MTERDENRLRKLMALALDVRGNKAECEAAGVKALNMAREAKLNGGELARVLNPAALPERDPVADAMAEGCRDAVNDLFAELLKPRRRRRT